MLEIFLDTSVLPRPREHVASGFRIMRRLCDEGLANVYVAEMALREWHSQLQDDLAKVRKDCKVRLGDLLRHQWADRLPNLDILQQALESLDSTGDDDGDWRDTMKSMGLQAVPLKDDHAQRVFEKYFGGVPPFRAQGKKRDDIPDAFIYECAVDLLDDARELHCVVNDDQLRDTLSRLDGVHVYATVKEFSECDAAQSALRRLDDQTLWMRTWHDRRKWQDEFEKMLPNALDGALLNRFLGKVVRHEDIPEDNQEATIVGLSDFDARFHWQEADTAGLGMIFIPFDLECEAEVEFLLYRSEAFDLPNGTWVSAPADDPYEHHYWEAGGTLQLVIAGSLSVTVDFRVSTPEIIRTVIESVDYVSVERNPRGGIFR